MEEYIIYIVIGVIVALALLLAFITGAGSFFKDTFDKYDQVKNHMGVTPEQFIVIMKEIENVKKLEIARIEGTLTDCYVPKKKLIALSESTYQNTSVSAVTVVAHEFGHSLQHSKNAALFGLYHTTGVIFNFFARFVLIALIVGFIMIFATSEYIETGWTIIYGAGAVLGCGLLYKIFTIPVEYNASKRALKILEEQRIFNQEELKMAKKVLSTAASTYVADFLATMMGINLIRKLRRRKYWCLLIGNIMLWELSCSQVLSLQYTHNLK